MAKAIPAASRPDAYHRRLVSNLRRNPGATEALEAFGLGTAEAAQLGLGIKEPYAKSDGGVVEGVLAYPIAVGGGRQKFGCVNLAGVTRNAEHQVAWSAGDALTVRHGDGASTVIVATGPIDVWRLGLAAGRARADIAVVASSQTDKVPAEWLTSRFWSRWTRLLVLSDVAAGTREAIAKAARRPLELGTVGAPPPKGQMTAKADDDWLGDLLAGAGRVQGAETLHAAPVGEVEGDFEADPIALHGGFARGHLLYPFRVERRSRVGRPGGRLVHSYETLVLRGDGAILEAEVLPAPPGTPPHRRVHALTDGTRILAAPEPSRTASWSLEGIRAYSAARMGGVDPCLRAPADILADVHELVVSRVSLPTPADAWVVTGFIVLTHVFRVFDAMPLLLAVGAKGSGKSELASVVASLGFNSTTMAQGSAAALVRLSADCGGLIVLDDVEGLSADSGAFGELAQCLKTGYKATTSRKPVTGPSGRVQLFDFYGPRLITSTRGVDPVLASRCLAIATRVSDNVRPTTEIDAALLRDELHALAMSRAGEIHEAYTAIAMGIVDRADEIRAPLLAIADALGCLEIRLGVGQAADGPRADNRLRSTS